MIVASFCGKYQKFTIEEPSIQSQGPFNALDQKLETRGPFAAMLKSKVKQNIVQIKIFLISIDFL